MDRDKLLAAQAGVLAQPSVKEGAWELAPAGPGHLAALEEAASKMGPKEWCPVRIHGAGEWIYSGEQPGFSWRWCIFADGKLAGGVCAADAMVVKGGLESSMWIVPEMRGRGLGAWAIRRSLQAAGQALGADVYCARRNSMNMMSGLCLEKAGLLRSSARPEGLGSGTVWHQCKAF